MGFTVEDMLLVSKARYRMKLVAGQNGWSNSISWILMLEDLTIVQRFSGKELAVTTGLGFDTEDKLLKLAGELVRQQASGLVVNTGYYIKKIPDRLMEYADRNSLPLLTVPWDVTIADMIKDLSIRIFLQGSTDEQISEAFIEAIESPDEYDKYNKVLLPHFDLSGSFQAVLLHQPSLGEMDTVERKRIAYRLQLALTNLTHNGHFFYYDSCFVVIINAVKWDQTRPIILQFRENIRKRIPDQRFVIGVGSRLIGIRSLHLSYARARAATEMAEVLNMEKGTSKDAYARDLVLFDDMGIYRLLSSVSDRQLLLDFEKEYLGPLLAYDAGHKSDYTDTLEYYLKCGGSIQKVAQAMFIHRNTILYRMNHIREILNTPLDDEDEKLNFRIACLIRRMMHTP